MIGIQHKKAILNVDLRSLNHTKFSKKKEQNMKRIKIKVKNKIMIKRKKMKIR